MQKAVHVHRRGTGRESVELLSGSDRGWESGANRLGYRLQCGASGNERCATASRLTQAPTMGSHSHPPAGRDEQVGGALRARHRPSHIRKHGGGLRPSRWLANARTESCRFTSAGAGKRTGRTGVPTQPASRAPLRGSRASRTTSRLGRLPRLGHTLVTSALQLAAPGEAEAVDRGEKNARFMLEHWSHVNADLDCTPSPTGIAHSGGRPAQSGAYASCRLGRRARGDAGLTGAVAKRVASARCSHIR